MKHDTLPLRDMQFAAHELLEAEFAFAFAFAYMATYWPNAPAIFA